MYQPLLTIPPRRHEQLLPPRVARLRRPRLALRLLLGLGEVFGGEAGAEAGAGAVVGVRL